MNIIVSVCFAVVLAQCVWAEETHETHNMKPSEDFNPGLWMPFKPFKFPSPEYPHNCPCEVAGVTGRCVYLYNCGIVRRPGFDFSKEGSRNPCERPVDYCCPEAEILLED